ncbi:uncharacterized protein LOC142574194 [Dermacentor variabilis]|uniref:uncharacterized protein LOC142574194 n=1 Tax=Dermacentor variabilis TaxID=34621 RepID=UPI003F5C4850
MFPKILILLCYAVSRCEVCDVDDREVVYYATEIGRATQRTVRECIPLIKDIQPYPPNELVIKFLKSVCDESQACAKELKTLELQAIVPCSRKKLWAIWQDTLSYDLKTQKVIEKILDCAVSVVPNTKVGWHLIKVALRVAG